MSYATGTRLMIRKLALRGLESALLRKNERTKSIYLAHCGMRLRASGFNHTELEKCSRFMHRARMGAAHSTRRRNCADQSTPSTRPRTVRARRSSHRSCAVAQTRCTRATTSFTTGAMSKSGARRLFPCNACTSAARAQPRSRSRIASVTSRPSIA